MSSESVPKSPKQPDGIDERSAIQRLQNADDTLNAAGRGLDLLEHWQFTTTDPQWILEARNGTIRQLPLAVRDEARERLSSGLRILTVFGPATTLALQALSSVEPGFAKWWSPRSAALGMDPLARFFWDMRVSFAHRGTAGFYNIVTRYDSVDLSYDTATPSGHIALEFLSSPTGSVVEAYELSVRYLELLGTILAEAWAEFAPQGRSTDPRRPVGLPASAAFIEVSRTDGSSLTHQLRKVSDELAPMENMTVTNLKWMR